jgi:hypothetical protein
MASPFGSPMKHGKLGIVGRKRIWRRLGSGLKWQGEGRWPLIKAASFPSVMNPIALRGLIRCHKKNPRFDLCAGSTIGTG